MTIFAKYQELITSPEQITFCREAKSIAQLLSIIKKLWHQEKITDDELFAQLLLCNQKILHVDKELLNQCWLPYRYDAKSRSVFWCLRDGKASEPFHDQFISRCRQQVLLNQLIVPKTTLQNNFPVPKKIEPAGFIFHLSRCGSTLVSGSFAELEQASVLSESQLLTEFLLDPHLSHIEKQQWLPTLIRWQIEADKSAIIKWNAWDIFQFSMIRTLFPQTPMILLVRNPVEILASHQRAAGRHMSGDSALTSIHPVFSGSANTLLDFRISVLNELQKAMLAVSSEPNVMVVDYKQLNPDKVTQISEHFGVRPERDALKRIEARMQAHSKEPERQFKPDSQAKQQVFSPVEQQKICEQLMPVYEQLLSQRLN